MRWSVDRNNELSIPCLPAREHEGKEWIAHYSGQQTISFPDEEAEQLKREEDAMTEHIVSNIIGTSLKSPQTIINKVYDRIGFNAVQDEELRHR